MSNPSPHTASTREFSQGQLRFGEAFRVFRAILVASIFLISAIVFVRSAYAQEAPVDRTQVVKSLGEMHGESSVAMGLASNGGVLELFTSADGSTWTMILTMPDGKSRVVGAGEAWINVSAKPKGQPI